MTKKILVSLFIISSFMSAQDNSHLGIDDKTGKSILLGKVDREALVDSSFAWWFNSAYKFYKPDSTIISELKILDLGTTDIKLILGTWCSDSRREVPRFFKIIDLIEYPESQIEIIAVNRDKVVPESVDEIDNIEFVPTFIFYNENEETGRIVETPDNSLEEDMLDILE